MPDLSSIEKAAESLVANAVHSGAQAAEGLAAAAPALAVDLPKVLELVQEIVGAAPAIVAGLKSEAPYVEAIVQLIQTGGNPTDEQWASWNAQMKANSDELAKEVQDDGGEPAAVEAADAEGNVEAEPPAEPPAAEG